MEEGNSFFKICSDETVLDWVFSPVIFPFLSNVFAFSRVMTSLLAVVISFFTSSLNQRPTLGWFHFLNLHTQLFLCRLLFELEGDSRRRSILTTVFLFLPFLSQSLWPIMPHAAEEVSLFYSQIRGRFRGEAPGTLFVLILWPHFDPGKRRGQTSRRILGSDLCA